MAKTYLDDAIRDYLEKRVSERKSKSAIDMDRSALRRLQTHTGNIFVENINGKHMNQLFIKLAQTNSDRSLCNLHYIYEAFFAWCAKSKRMPRYCDPMEGRAVPSFAVEERRRIPVDYFPTFLDNAKYPWHRMLYSAAFYLLPRVGEIAQIRLEDINLTEKRIRVTVEKQTRGRRTVKTDLMPITRELDIELRRWLPEYADRCGRLQPKWHLIPNHSRPNFRAAELSPNGRWQPHTQELRPLHDMGKKAHVWAQAVMEQIGFETRDADGKPRREGMHTLRRSGARARFDALRELGYDGALRQVQALLHHRNSSMTELYIGMDLDKQARDEALMGEWMYPQLQGEENKKRLQGLQLISLQPGQDWQSDVLDLVA